MSRPGGCRSTGTTKLSRPRPCRCRMAARFVPACARRHITSPRTPSACPRPDTRAADAARPHLAVLVAVLLLAGSLLGLGQKAQAGEYVNFKTVTESQNVGSDWRTLENERIPEWNNLKIRTDYADATGASDEVVSKTGYRNPVSPFNWIGEKWDVGLFKYVTGGIKFGAYANNDNGPSNSSTLRAGWLQGRMYNNTIANGTKPDDIIINHNVDGLGGIFREGNYIDFSQKKPQDSYYFYSDVLFGDKQLRGDTTKLTTYDGMLNTLILPNMTALNLLKKREVVSR